jgi:putative mRNA 3-end processing factor
MVELSILGGGREVGRLSVLLNTGTEKFLLDHGIEVQTFGVPMKPAEPLDAILLSHAHLDHSGFVPALYKDGFKGNVYSHDATFELCSLLLRDSIKVQDKKGLEPFYMVHDIKKMEHLKKASAFGRKEGLGSSVIEFHSAGHIPGSCCFVVDSSGKRVMFTGDIKFLDTRLMKGAKMSYRDIDVLVTESTYSNKNHPERSALEDRLREIAQETIYNDGILLLPTFAVGRTQELLLILHDLGFPVFIDGMGINASEIINSCPESVKDPGTLKKAFGKAHKITKPSQRKAAIEKPSIILTTAGMLNGGPIGYYMKKLHKNENCAMVLTGYQVEETVGRKLLDTGRYVNEGLDVKPRMRTEHMDFSAHTDHDRLIEFFQKTNPGKIVLIHGDRTPEFAKELKGMGFDAVAPKNGDKIRL